jgi:hypothetical protein
MRQLGPLFGEIIEQVFDRTQVNTARVLQQTCSTRLVLGVPQIGVLFVALGRLNVAAHYDRNNIDGRFLSQFEDNITFKNLRKSRDLTESA